MGKYYVNWSKYVGLYILYFTLRIYFNIEINLFVEYLILVSIGMISVERVEK